MFIISYFYNGGIIEVGVLAIEDVAKRIANEMGVANHQVSAVMWMAVNLCGDSAVSNVVAEFGRVGGIENTAFVSLVESGKCR